MYKFFKHTKSNKDTVVNIYTPIHQSNILSFAHIVSTFTPEPKEGEETETKTIEYIAMQTTIIAEQARAVPLKAIKRVKQTKDEEYFLTEEVVKTMEPIIERIDDKESVDKLVKFLEENCI